MANTINNFILSLLTIFIPPFLFFFSISATVRNTVDQSRFSVLNQTGRLLLPQGWNFFTKDAKEDRVFILDSASKKSLLKGKCSSKQNYFGLKRSNRVQHVELAEFMANDRTGYTSCSGSWSECLALADNIDRYEITNDTHNPSLCGDLLVIKSPVIPWVWYSTFGITDRKNYQIKRIDVLCKN